MDSTVLRISGIIQGLRNISRDSSLESVEPAALSDIFNDVLSICIQKFKNHGVDFIFDAETIRGKVIPCRRVQVAQVLMNLLNNSFDAVRELDGEKWIKLEIFQHSEVLQIVVSDCGAGIPADLQAKIFQPFFTTKDVGKGTGLGLSLSKSIVEKHGGNLEITQDVPNTQFVISLPRKAA